MACHLDDPALAAVSARLPVFYHALFAAERAGATRPKDAGPEVGVSGHVVENERRLAAHRRQVKFILHDEHDIDVVRFLFRRYERTEDDKAPEATGRRRQTMDAL